MCLSGARKTNSDALTDFDARVASENTEVAKPIPCLLAFPRPAFGLTGARERQRTARIRDAGVREDLPEPEPHLESLLPGVRIASVACGSRPVGQIGRDNFLFADGEQFTCFDACDSNNDGVLDIGDVIRKVFVLFQSSTPLPAPYPDCGPLPGADCVLYTNCF